MARLNPQENKHLHRNYKRMMWFVCVFFVFALVICYLLQRAGLNPVLNGFIIICLAGVFYLLFWLICARIDKKREEKRKQDDNRDPFTH